MFFLPFIDILIANQPPELQIKPENRVDETLMKSPAPIKETFEIVPYQLNGSVENFDPIARANLLVQNLARKWCGSYMAFGESWERDVVIRFDEMNAIGQIVTMKGEMLLDALTIPVEGTLNAKSDQYTLLVLSDKTIAGLEPGGSFIGFQGISLLGWQASNLKNDGGRLKIQEKCSINTSKSPSIISTW